MSDCSPKALFEKLFEANNAKIYRFAFKLTEDAARAQEITQQCFIRLWENMHLVKEGQDVFPLLFVYVKHLVIDESRKLYREKKALSKAAAQQNTTDSSSERMFIHKEFQTHLHKVVEKMPEQRRNVYTLSRDHGFTHKEIGQQLSISPATVKNHLTAALQYIRRELLTHYDTDTQ
ncbi:RNA polymerase sigma-70 factor [Chitinophaga nivalis]|uniref:RNA polymerase sigma-70 factor n=1 Tax=Chitinophaga nivalis TaxID=2991709 RepID=A0ABT3IU34_9BACT|nr:RNA polymerase sigma-70 factor [Chitinophaga nivalis]MCW3462821.1 RNA polymerase sigma-70 factor [Chitinophaga nivalis]MCW3487489.1 RNA polymerase sigma-70 factor [Chitinophaga nivalis]